MISLLTLDGIPPQIIGSLAAPQQNSIRHYATRDKDEIYRDWQNCAVASMKPFAAVATGAVGSFVCWGAHVGNVGSLRLISSHLEIGGTTFPDDCNLHSDSLDAQSNLKKRGLIILRMLCVSSMPSDFIDLTGQEHMDVVLDRYRINASRAYEPPLLSLAESRGQVTRPKPWDVVVFDAATPHNPKVASEPHRRILQQAWIEMQLPSDWQDRVKSGDVPTLQPA